MEESLIRIISSTKGAVLQMVFETGPFFSRQVTSALVEVDGGIIEAAKSMRSGLLYQ